MKTSRTIVVVFIMLIVCAALYRLIPGRPYGFAPQIAIALFGGAILKNKKWAFAIPLFSMFLSDLLFQGLYQAGMVDMQGFYEGQWINYLLLAGLAVLGMTMGKVNAIKIGAYSVGAPILYFILSNTAVWLGSGGFGRPMTGAGWMMTLTDGLPFLYNSVAATLFFSALLFGSFFLYRRNVEQKAITVQA